ncbi:PE/PPE C-terminal domain-containing protein [Mycobacterium ostraviense]|uniref:PE/PPE C-terminal domain-containing protein n=1 Tax=Mycobacterium ostraviense TaxID=2738409 RepID=UPI0015D5015A|nr:PE/PPE C-terminal domain-containing protein [Mycobacterium ostraviense]UGT92416.1 PE/PPE C-terminal domain-containing protein [Mycobacterium ostraviense]
MPTISAPAASASVGQAASLGTLSVPPSWAETLSAAPVTPAGAVAVPEAQLSAVPAAANGGCQLSRLPLGGMVGREADGAVQRVGVRSSVIPHSPMGG